MTETSSVPLEPTAAFAPSAVLSFDIEEHDRIEAAKSFSVSATMKADYATRMERVTYQILDQLAATGTLATFYIVGEIAVSHPKLVKTIAGQGHEIGAHSWDHRRVHRFDPRRFSEDLRVTKDKLEQVSGSPVFGFRAPTFSVTRETAWAVDCIHAAGYQYDTSIYPVRHDRYGIPDAPRSPFLAVGPGGAAVLELPPVTYRMLGQNLPVAGGGYFRLFPLWVTRKAVRQMLTNTAPPVAMIYLHPWEFDPTQPKLPLGRLSKFRTYVGVKKCFAKLEKMLSQCVFRRAIDVVNDLEAVKHRLPRFEVSRDAKVLSARVAVEAEKVAS